MYWKVRLLVQPCIRRGPAWRHHHPQLSLWPLACALVVLARASSTETPGLEDLRSTAAFGDEWNSTAVRLQPNLQTETQTDMQTQSPTNNYTGLSCMAVLPPRRGSFYVESGAGMTVGSVLAFWCREGYQLVGSDKIYCSVRNGKPQWSNYLPVCEAIPRPEDRGLHVAVLASVVSGVVILAMSLSFLICCLQERNGRQRAKREGRSRRSENRSARRSECWLEREEGEWDAFPAPKIFHLSQRIDPRLAPDSPLYLTGGLTGYENRGYQRSQESLLKAPLPGGLYRSDSQLHPQYPHMVLQRVPTPTAPPAPSVYLHHHLPSSSAPSPSNTATAAQSSSQAHMTGPYSAAFGYSPPPNANASPAPPYPNPNPGPAPGYPQPNASAAPPYPNPNPGPAPGYPQPNTSAAPPYPKPNYHHNPNSSHQQRPWQ